MTEGTVVGKCGLNPTNHPEIESRRILFLLDLEPSELRFFEPVLPSKDQT